MPFRPLLVAVYMRPNVWPVHKFDLYSMGFVMVHSRNDVYFLCVLLIYLYMYVCLFLSTIYGE